MSGVQSGNWEEEEELILMTDHGQMNPVEPGQNRFITKCKS